MNSLYTLALRQSSSLTADLQQLASLYASPSTSTPSQTSALNGQINASLAALDRTIDDYDSMARREIVDVKKEKAMQRVAKFKDEYLQLRREYDRVKTQGQLQKTTSDRSELFAGAPSASASTSSIAHSHSYGASTSSRSFARPAQPQANHYASSNPYASSSPYSGSSGGGGGGGGDVAIPMGGAGGGGGGDYASSMHNNARTNYALREHDFMQQTGATLDAYLAQGQAVLGNLANQRDVMKGTQRRLLSAANTLGLSRETISFIERRTKADYYILLGGGAFTLFCLYLILHYFG